MQLTSAIALYLQSCRRRGRSTATLANYAHHLRSMSGSIGDVDIGEVGLESLRAWVDQLLARGLRPRSIWSAVVCCRAFCAWLVSEQFLQENPSARLEKPHLPQPVPRALDVEDVCDLFESARLGACPERDRALLAFIVDTGVRRGGVAGLLMDDLRLAEGYAVIVGKGGSQYCAFFWPKTSEMLNAWLQVRDPDRFKPQIDPRSVYGLTGLGIQRRLERLAEDAGLDRRVGAHALRHTCAVMRVEQGIDSAALMQVMGWQDIRMAEVYTRLAKHRMRRLALATSPMKTLPID